MKIPIYQHILFFFMITGLTVATLIFQLAQAADSLDEWRKPAHEWRKQGKCLDCHRDSAQGHTMRPPDYHTEQFRDATHGRTPTLTPSKCYGCHEIQTCQACHRRKPATHTESFIHPDQTNGEGLTRHLLMGRLRPSACLVCHQSFVSECTPCHTPSEVTPWEEQALSQLVPWKILRHVNP